MPTPHIKRKAAQLQRMTAAFMRAAVLNMRMRQMLPSVPPEMAVALAEVENDYRALEQMSGGKHNDGGVAHAPQR